MKNNFNKQSAVEKPHKSKFYIVGKIYFYIIGVNLVLLVASNIFSKIVPVKETLIVTIDGLLVSVIVSFFAIKWGAESVFQKSSVYPHEIWKISLLVGIVPVIVSFLFSAWIILINLGNISAVAWYLIPRLFGEFIVIFISGLFYGGITYFWFKKLSRKT